ncbi:MAG: hypothetical protein MHM6MM_004337 [Cercozoa sp. M6MM]
MWPAQDQAECFIVGPTPACVLDAEGFLYKKARGVFTKDGRWQQRYFLLNAHALAYLRGPGDVEEPQVRFELSQVREIIYEDGHENGGCEFTVVTGRRKKATHHFRAASPVLADMWVKALRKAVDTDSRTALLKAAAGDVSSSTHFVRTLAVEAAERRPHRLTKLQHCVANLLARCAWRFDMLHFLRELQRGYLEDVHCLQLLLFILQGRADEDLEETVISGGLTLSRRGSSSTRPRRGSGASNVTTLDDIRGVTRNRSKTTAVSDERRRSLFRRPSGMHLVGQAEPMFGKVGATAIISHRQDLVTHGLDETLLYPLILPVYNDATDEDSSSRASSRRGSIGGSGSEFDAQELLHAVLSAPDEVSDHITLGQVFGSKCAPGTQNSSLREETRCYSLLVAWLLLRTRSMSDARHRLQRVVRAHFSGTRCSPAVVTHLFNLMLSEQVPRPESHCSPPNLLPGQLILLGVPPPPQEMLDAGQNHTVVNPIFPAIFEALCGADQHLVATSMRRVNLMLLEQQGNCSAILLQESEHWRNALLRLFTHIPAQAMHDVLAHTSSGDKQSNEGNAQHDCFSFAANIFSILHFHALMKLESSLLDELHMSLLAVDRFCAEPSKSLRLARFMLSSLLRKVRARRNTLPAQVNSIPWGNVLLLLKAVKIFVLGTPSWTPPGELDEPTEGMALSRRTDDSVPFAVPEHHSQIEQYGVHICFGNGTPPDLSLLEQAVSLCRALGLHRREWKDDPTCRKPERAYLETANFLFACMENAALFVQMHQDKAAHIKSKDMSKIVANFFKSTTELEHRQCFADIQTFASTSGF